MGILVWNSDETFLRKVQLYTRQSHKDLPSWIFTWRAKHVKRTANPRIYIYYANIRIVIGTDSAPIEIDSNSNITLSLKELEEMNQAIKEALEVMQPISDIRDVLE